jgi:hypothetical protein
MAIPNKVRDRVVAGLKRLGAEEAAKKAAKGKGRKK